jgi:hypothetical protein
MARQEVSSNRTMTEIEVAVVDEGNMLRTDTYGPGLQETFLRKCDPNSGSFNPAEFVQYSEGIKRGSVVAINFGSDSRTFSQWVELGRPREIRVTKSYEAVSV